MGPAELPDLAHDHARDITDMKYLRIYAHLLYLLSWTDQNLHVRPLTVTLWFSVFIFIFNEPLLQPVTIDSFLLMRDATTCGWQIKINGYPGNKQTWGLVEESIFFFCLADPLRVWTALWPKSNCVFSMKPARNGGLMVLFDIQAVQRLKYRRRGNRIKRGHQRP